MFAVLKKKNAQCYHFDARNLFAVSLWECFIFLRTITHMDALAVRLSHDLRDVAPRIPCTVHISLEYSFGWCAFLVGAEEHFEMLEKHMKKSIWYTRCCCTWSKDRWWKPKHHHIKSNLFVAIACEHNMSALFGVCISAEKEEEAKKQHYEEINKENVYASLVIDSLLCTFVSMRLRVDLYSDTQTVRWMVSISMLSPHIAQKPVVAVCANKSKS